MTTRTDDTTTNDAPMEPGRVAIPITADDLRGAIEGMGRSVPGVARTSRDAMEDAMHRIENASDDRVAAGATLSLGLAIGMLVGGAPRLLVAAALVPVAAMGMVLFDRRTRAAGRGARTSA